MTSPPPVRWPAGFSPVDADLHGVADAVIGAPAERVWAHVTVIDNWVRWCARTSDGRVRGRADGRLTAESVFTLELTSHHTFDVTVAEFVERRRLGVFGYSESAAGYAAVSIAAATTDSCSISVAVSLNRGGSPTGDGLAELVADQSLAAWLTAIRVSVEHASQADG